MNYYSTQRKTQNVSFREAAILGQAPDKGLYFPESIPVLPSTFFKELKTLSKEEIAFRVMRPYISVQEMDDDTLQKICSETVSFSIPLVQVDDDAFALELYHGPTLAFKDVGARFMSRCLGHFAKGNDKEITVLVATSGDTGGAVAAGFLGVQGVKVVILYPSGKVSHVQELQLTALGKNITALEVNGTFDDCQRMVKQAFLDEELNKKLFLTSANSINIARWLPQQLYYFYALQQWSFDEAPVISVPSGNYGNIAAGMLAYKSGLPVAHFIAACNANDVFTNYLSTASYNPKQAVATISNAMDVGDPSNFVRIQELFGSYESIKNGVSSESISDSETRTTIKDTYEQRNYLLDPHGAVAYKALKDYQQHHKGKKGIFLETAHPIKFAPVVEEIIGKTIDAPSEIASLLSLQKSSVLMEAKFEELKGLFVE